MAIRFSEKQIDSFCGNVMPLMLFGEEALSQKEIRWSVTGDAVMLRTFEKEEEFPFADGVLLTMVKPGEAEVCAVVDGEELRCAVRVREMKKADPDAPMNYYIGDFHDHASEEHNHDRFAVRDVGFPIECISQIRDEGKLDFHVISDHAVTLNPRDFFRGFADERAAQPMELVVFPGSESEVEVVEFDRYGCKHKNSGEIVTVNASNFAHVRSWEAFYEKMAGSPFAVCALAHPQVIGWSVPGIWNFSLEKNNTPQLKRMVRMVEMGNGGDRESNLINEYFYSVALDNGFRVSTTCSSDSHGPEWGYDVFPGKTVIMAQEKSKEAFLDALMNNRVYACESGNIKLRVEANGHAAPAELALARKYDFRVEIGYFHEDSATRPILCQVISDQGRTVKELECAGQDAFEFSVESDSASYFYLRLVDAEGRKTWSPPVWTGRKAENAPAPELTPIDKAGFTAIDRLSGKDAGLLVSDDPAKVWTADGTQAEILIDMQKAHEICAIGHYPVPLTHVMVRESGRTHAENIAQFLCGYRVSVSEDGRTFEAVADGSIRVFGGEEIIRFAPRKARYVMIEALSTVGRASGIPKYEKASLSISELTIFKA